jgi:hypothetical protein
MGERDDPNQSNSGEALVGVIPLARDARFLESRA